MAAPCDCPDPNPIESYSVPCDKIGEPNIGDPTDNVFGELFLPNRTAAEIGARVRAYEVPPVGTANLEISKYSEVRGSLEVSDNYARIVCGSYPLPKPKSYIFIVH